MFKPGALVKLKLSWESWHKTLVHACTNKAMLGLASDKSLPTAHLINAVAEVIEIDHVNNVIVYWHQFNCYNSFLSTSLRYANATTTENT